MNLSKCSPWMTVKDVFLVLLIAGISFAQEALPDGWHRPTLAEAKGQWRKKSRTRFLEVRGDFNGDGRVDLAELLISDSGKQCGLFVRFAGADSRWQALWQPDTPH